MALIIFAVVLAIIVLPVKMAANFVGARNTGVFMCILALFFAGLIQQSVSTFIPNLAAQHPALDSIVSLFLSGLAYMLVLGTTYAKGLVIAIIQILLTLVLYFIAGLFALGH